MVHGSEIIGQKFNSDHLHILANGGTLESKYKDHDLKGNYKETRECHIEPD